MTDLHIGQPEQYAETFLPWQSMPRGSSVENVSRKSRLLKKGNNQREIIPHALLNLTPNLILIVEPKGKIVEANQYACDLLKFPEHKLLEHSVFDFLPRDDQVRIKSLMRDCVLAKRIQSTQTRLIVGEKNATMEIHLSVSHYMKSRTSREQYYVLIARDISEEKRKELELLRFSNIAHYTVNPVEVTNPEGRIVYVNPAFERASGYTKEEIIGKNPNIFGSGKQKKAFWQKVWATISSGKVWTGEVENRRKSGEEFFTNLLISPIIDPGGTIVGYFGVHRDITEQKLLEKQLVHAQKMESIGLLAAGVAHEVGNPLTSISSLVQVIQRTTEDEFTHEKLELIKSQIIRISRIIRDLVDFSRRSSYEVQLTDVNKNIREAVEIVRVGRKAKAISFDVNLDESIPMLPLVPDQVEQVFINILINAVDAINADLASAPEHHMRKKGQIGVFSSMTDENVVIRIQDNGNGVAEHIRLKIFEPFFTTKKVGEGTGLGLWVSYGIIKSFQGNITAESAEGAGATFTITLPLQTE